MATLDKVAVDITVVLGHHVHAHPPSAAARRRRDHRTGCLGGGCRKYPRHNLPVARGTVVVNGNCIAVNVAELLPRPPDMR